MGAAPLVIVLVGLAVPIVALVVTLVFDVFVAIWLLYRLWHDEWSVQLWHTVRRSMHAPYWHRMRYH